MPPPVVKQHDDTGYLISLDSTGALSSHSELLCSLPAINQGHTRACLPTPHFPSPALPSCIRSVARAVQLLSHLGGPGTELTSIDGGASGHGQRINVGGLSIIQ